MENYDVIDLTKMTSFFFRRGKKLFLDLHTVKKVFLFLNKGSLRNCEIWQYDHFFFSKKLRKLRHFALNPVISVKAQIKLQK